MAEKKTVARLELRPRAAAYEDLEKEPEATPEAQAATVGDASAEVNTPIKVECPERQPERAATDRTAGTPDLDKQTDPEEIDFEKELTEYEKNSISSVLLLLESKGFTQIRIAKGVAKMWDPGQPDTGPNYDEAKAAVEKAYTGNQSKNDNTFFTTSAPDPETGMGGSAKEMTLAAERLVALAAEKKLIVVSSEDLQKFVQQETSKAVRGAVASIFKKFGEAGYSFTREAREGIQQTGQTPKQTDIQKEMEASDPPRGDVQDDMPYDMADPSDIEALDRVDQMPFDKVSPSVQVEGRQITRDPAKV